MANRKSVELREWEEGLSELKQVTEEKEEPKVEEPEPEPEPEPEQPTEVM